MRKSNLTQAAAFIAAFAVSAGVLAGCGSSSGGSSASGSAGAASTAAASSAASTAAADTAAGSSADSTAAGSSADSSATASSDASSAASTAAVSSADAVTVTAVTGGDTRPYVYVGDDNQLTGVDIEILKSAFDRMDGYNLDLQTASFDAIFAGLTAGQYQIGVNNFSYRAERAENYLYSYPYNKISYVFVYRADEDPITTFADAAGKSAELGAGVSVTNAVETWNEKNPDKQIKIDYTEADMTTKLQHVVDGAYDFNIVDAAMYDAYEKEYNFGLKASVINDEDTAMIADNVYAYYLLPLDQKDLRDKLDVAIKSLRDDGTIKKITEEYENYDGTPEEDQYDSTIN